jgi:phosphoribosylformylglycinamidine synthase subunit PurQ / glutaminase
MKIAVMQFPGTNCEHETLVAVKATGMEGEIFRWNRSAGELSDFDGFIIPGGFSYQDRIRAGAIAAKEPVMDALKEEAAKGKPIIGICNGFQILVESGLLPGTGKVDMALAQNVMIKGGNIVRRGYYCDWINLRHDASPKRCSGSFLIDRDAILQMPIAHGEGNLVTKNKDLIKNLNDEGQVVFRYCDSIGAQVDEFPVNVNGSTESIAAICNPEGNVLGMMPHPERAFFAWQLPSFDQRKHQKDAPGPGRQVFESMKRYIEVKA